MDNPWLLLLYPLLGFICRMSPFCVRPVISEKSIRDPFVSEKKSSRRSIHFDDGSSSCIRSTSLLIYMPCYLWTIIIGAMIWYFIFCLFPPLFFMVMMTTKIFLLLLYTFASPRIYSLEGSDEDKYEAGTNFYL